MAFNLPTSSLFTSEEQRKLMAAMPGCEYRMVPTIALQDFKNHPYHVEEGEEMLRLIKSVKSKGILVPLIVRDAPNMMYEVLSGHRRKYAAEFNSIDTVPALVYHDLSDEDGTIIMVDSNLHRENIQPSERAFAYRMKAEAMRKKILENGADEEIVGRVTENIDEEQSRKTVENYIRLTYLIRELLEMVDARTIPVYAGVDLSYLTRENQTAVYHWISDTANMKQPRISMSQAASLRKLQAGDEPDSDGVKPLEESEIREVMQGKKQKGRKVSILFADLEPLMPGVSTGNHGKKRDAAVRDYIMKAVAFYRENHPEQKTPGGEETEF
ncbi:MAG: ParB/RepB/Spo0J family partition protein [Lachnospiraceae bacterium]|nr:ParB/RepB/Spo0J family partition protein [Lachnospiraceae bacterium]